MGTYDFKICDKNMENIYEVLNVNYVREGKWNVWKEEKGENNIYLTNYILLNCWTLKKR